MVVKKKKLEDKNWTIETLNAIKQKELEVCAAKKKCFASVDPLVHAGKKNFGVLIT